jgi:drug/metabolite transporter (DMT)-like permease
LFGDSLLHRRFVRTQLEKHIVAIIGLLFDLSGAYLLATDGIGIRIIRRIAMQPRVGDQAATKSEHLRWGAPLSLGALVTLATCFILYELRGQKVWPIALWALSILVQAAWVPAISAFSIPFLPDVGRPVNDRRSAHFYLIAICLLGVGFTFEALSAVLD